MSDRSCFVVLACVLLGCPADDGGGGGNDEGSTSAATGSTTASSTATPSTSASASSSSTSASETGSSSESGEASSGSSETGSSSTGEPFEPCFERTLDAALCDPEQVEFTLDSTNPYYPLVVGTTWVLEGPDGAALVRIEREVLPETELVFGVETHVLEHYEYVDGDLVEIARNFYVESTDGTVCYFGEDVENYDGGMLVNTNGTWRAGIDGAWPGIIMPADPQPDEAYFQENAPGAAQDQGQVQSIGTTEMIGDMSYDDVVTIHDVNPLETCDEAEPKLYPPGIGEAADVDVVLIEFTAG